MHVRHGWRRRNSNRAPRACDELFSPHDYDFCLRCGWLVLDHVGHGAVIIQELP